MSAHAVVMISIFTAALVLAHFTAGNSNDSRVSNAFRAAPRNCAAARSLSLDNARRGQPGYAPHLDRDGDGIACEPYYGRRN